MMRRTIVCLRAAAWTVGLPAAAGAHAQTTFSIDPLLVKLDADTRNAVVTLTNTSSREIRFEIKAFTWSQVPPDGAMTLTPTTDVVVFPPLVTLKPKTTQRLRVGTTAAQGSIEKAYRIMVEELPGGAAPPDTSRVAVRTRIGVPVFIAPTTPSVSGRIDPPRIAKGVVEIPLTNTGTTHAMVDSVVLRGHSGPDEVAFEDAMQGWYVLAGLTRVWRYNLRPAQCRSLKFFEIEVYAHDRVVTSRADMPAGACSP